MKLCKNLAILIFASAMVFLNFGAAFAQTSETFDIVSFKTPKGWEKKPAESAVQFTKEDAAKRTYCLMTLYKSVYNRQERNTRRVFCTIYSDQRRKNFAPSKQTIQQIDIPDL